MAHFVIATDPDPPRRRQFADTAQARLDDLQGLVVSRFECGDSILVTGRSPNAPHSEHQTAHSLACLLGYAVDENGQWLEAESIFRIWNGSGDSQLGGYFGAITCSSSGDVVVGCDLLGFFPVYYTQCGDVLIAGSSPELISAHPDFKTEPDLRGLAGILLTNGLTSNRPLLQRVKRLRPGNQLRWQPARNVREVEIFSLSKIESDLELSAASAREIADAELSRAIRWHRPRNTPTTLMLSGGLDSRLMAGYLFAERITDRAIGLGRKSDFEVQVGGRAAKSLGWKFDSENQEPDPVEFAAAAHRIARWEHLAGGFSHLETLSSAKAVGQSAPMFWSGFSLEDVLGGDAYLYGWNESSGTWTFEALLARLNSWGIAPPVLSRLLETPDAAELVSEVIAGFEREYEECSSTKSQRATFLKLLTRARFHVGSVIHRLSFQSWPLLPFLDRQLLERLLAIPPELKMHRRLQKDLLLHCCPKLADIPREHNSFLLEPLRPSPFFWRTASIRKRLRRWYWRKWRKEEPRRYYRCYDLNSPHWKAVRSAAEPIRPELETLFVRSTLDQLLPPPGSPISYKEPISESGPARLLLGLLLWEKRG